MRPLAPRTRPWRRRAGRHRRRRRRAADAGAVDQRGARRRARGATAAVLVFGEDVAVKGGVYGVTRGLQRRFGAGRVFDTLLDETTILGLALGARGQRPPARPRDPVPRLPAQRRGPAARRGGDAPVLLAGRSTGTRWWCGSRATATRRGSAATSTTTTRSACCATSRASWSRRRRGRTTLRRCCARASTPARVDGSVCVFLEPIALYHTRDLHERRRRRLARAPRPDDVPLGRARTYGDGGDLTIVSWANGLRMSLRVARRLEAQGCMRGWSTCAGSRRCRSPTSLREATATGRVLVVDETRRTGGVSEGVVAALVDAGFGGSIARVASKDSFIPLGDAANLVLLSEDEIERRRSGCDGLRARARVRRLRHSEGRRPGRRGPARGRGRGGRARSGQLPGPPVSAEAARRLDAAVRRRWPDEPHPPGPQRAQPAAPRAGGRRAGGGRARPAERRARRARPRRRRVLGRRSRRWAGRAARPARAWTRSRRRSR